jgi:hypothetical protein
MEFCFLLNLATDIQYIFCIDFIIQQHDFSSVTSLPNVKFDHHFYILSLV